ncbi:MAG: hypothetical protein ABJA70_20665 [Chryseolinea sp.]
MKNSFLVMVILIIVSTVGIAQSGFEVYSYISQTSGFSFVPIAHFQTRNNWYAEARYNYDEVRTFSLYLGKTFSGTKKDISYSVTPMIGGMLGQFKGGSAALNASLEYKRFFLSSQPQFTAFSGERDRSYIFHWSELGYELRSWLFAGVSIQQTYYTQSKMNNIEPGILLGVTLGKWILPLYLFNPLSTSAYYVLGITYGLGSVKSIR